MNNVTEYPNDPNSWTHKDKKWRCPFVWDEYRMRRGCDDHVASGDVFKCQHIDQSDYRSCTKKKQGLK
jgi:hypothetical protein